MPTTTALLGKGTKVQLIEGSEVIDTGVVVSDNRSEMEIESSQRYPGVRDTFAYGPEYGGWKLIFPGLGGERCINLRGPTYEIKPIE